MDNGGAKRIVGATAAVVTAAFWWLAAGQHTAGTPGASGEPTSRAIGVGHSFAEPNGDPVHPVIVPVPEAAVAERRDVGSEGPPGATPERIAVESPEEGPPPATLDPLASALPPSTDPRIAALVSAGVDADTAREAIETLDSLRKAATSLRDNSPGLDELLAIADDLPEQLKAGVVRLRSHPARFPTARRTNSASSFHLDPLFLRARLFGSALEIEFTVLRRDPRDLIDVEQQWRQVDERLQRITSSR